MATRNSTSTQGAKRPTPAQIEKMAESFIKHDQFGVRGEVILDPADTQKLSESVFSRIFASRTSPEVIDRRAISFGTALSVLLTSGRKSKKEGAK